MYNAVHKAIDNLPDQCRKIYLMKKYDDLSYNEIAEIHGVSINTVKTQMKRAMKSLLKQLAYLRTIILIFISLYIFYADW
jgi:RNA polymerase sigma-70 factor (ECF subfamily)